MNPLDWPARHPITTLIIASVLVLISIVMMSRLRPETSLDAMLDRSDPATIALGRVLQGFPVAEELLVLASLPDGVDVSQSIQLTDFADRLQSQLRADYSDTVMAVRYKPTPQTREFIEKIVAPAGLLYLTDDQVRRLRERLTPESMAEQFSRNETLLASPGPAAGGLAKAILQDPLRLHELLVERLTQLTPAAMRGDAFFSPSGRDLLIRIEGTRPLSDIDFAAHLTETVTRVSDGCNIEKLDIQIAGGYAIASHNASTIRRDAIVNSICTIILLALAMLILYRKPMWVFTVAFVPVAVGIVIGFGVYAVFRTSVTPLAMVIGGALGGIGIDYTIHLLSHHSASDRHEATTLARRLFIPLLAAWATSVIGFAVIGISPVQLLRDFALLGSLALTGAFLAALAILPALLALWPKSATPRLIIRKTPWHRPQRLLTMGLMILIPFILLTTQSDLTRQDADLHNLHPQPNPPLVAQDNISRIMRLDGTSALIHVQADSDQQLLSRCAAIQTRLMQGDAHTNIRSVFGPASLLPDPDLVSRRLLSFSDQSVQTIVNNFQHTVAQSGFSPVAYKPYAAALPRLLRPDHIPALDDLRQYPDLAEIVLPRESHRHEAIIHLFLDQPVQTRAQLSEWIDSTARLLDQNPGATLTGMSVISHRTLASVHRDLPRVSFLAVGCVAAYLAFHYRSFLMAGLAVVPLIISMIILAATMHLADLTLNVVNMVMLPLLLGINIDFGIFAADALRLKSRDEIASHFKSSVQAMFTCSLTTIIGFGSLSLTSIPAVRSLGMMIITGVTGCVVGTLFIMWPIVLMIANRRSTK